MSMLTQWFIGGFYGHFPPTERGLQKNIFITSQFIPTIDVFVVFLTIFGTFDIRQRERGIFLRYQTQKLVIE